MPPSVPPYDNLEGRNSGIYKQMDYSRMDPPAVSGKLGGRSTCTLKYTPIPERYFHPPEQR